MLDRRQKSFLKNKKIVYHLNQITRRENSRWCICGLCGYTFTFVIIVGFLFQQYEYILVPYELRKCSVINSSFKLYLLPLILNLMYYLKKRRIKLNLFLQNIVWMMEFL